jgi:hypothetical protein
MLKPRAAGRKEIPEMFRFLGSHLAGGIAAGLAFALALVLTNAAGLRDLLATVEDPYVAIILLFAFNALTFGSLAMGIGVMTMPMDTPCDMRERRRQNEDDHGVKR